MSNYHYFDDAEIAKWQLQPELWAMLDAARQKAGIPFIITSGKRTPDQESALKGGVRDSSHITGWGVDLAVTDDHSLCLILIGLFSAGFKRVGIYHDSAMRPTHIHADADPDLLAKTNEACWLLLEQNC